MQSKTIVFIHGMFMTALCWEKWVPYFQGRGYTCLAPNWPGRDKPVEELRREHPNPQLGRLGLSDVVDHFENIIRQRPEKPLLVGHSMGGLVTQLLLQRDVAAAGVAIDSAPPAGVFTPSWSFLKANFPMINPFVPASAPRRMPLEDFQYAFVNTLPLAEQQADYERYVVPESRQVPRDSLASAGAIDFKKAHAPLLLIAGEKDHIIPAGLNKINYEKYHASASRTDFKEFPWRVHFIIGQTGWEEVAQYVAGWIEGG
jgi:pimeloyl-ACP methyl ester carboxylesterase